MHGYQVIQEIGERTSGAWRPSPGAIYPALSLLEDEGLVTITAEGGRKLASLTDDGRTYVTEHADELGTPWQDVADGGVRPARQLRGALASVAAALQQVARSGSDEQAAQAVALLERTRRELYLILAGPAETPADETPAAPETPAREAVEACAIETGVAGGHPPVDDLNPVLGTPGAGGGRGSAPGHHAVQTAQRQPDHEVQHACGERGRHRPGQRTREVHVLPPGHGAPREGLVR